MNPETTSVSFINALLERNPDIVSYRLLPFLFDNKIQSRVADFSKKESEILQLTLEHKKTYSVGFWEAYLRICSSDRNLQRRLTEGAIFHKANEGFLYFRNDGSDALKKVSEETMVALNSEVILENGYKRHIPLLDFKIRSGGRSLPVVREVLQSLKLTGGIFDSGNSYHFVGDNLVTQSELIELLARFVLLHPVSDKSWAAHQIIEKSASIRVSQKNGSYPAFVSLVD